MRHFFVPASVLGVTAAATLLHAAPARAADHAFFGRSGDAVPLDFSRLPGVAPGAAFSNLSLAGFSTHTILTTDDLFGTSFAQTGRFYAFADHQKTPGTIGGDRDPDAPGFQGVVGGSVDIDGLTRTFTLTFQPGYSGVGPNAVGQSLERLNRLSNNPFFVAQQQHRLGYFGFVADGGGLPQVTANFGNDTDDALRTFQAAFVGGLNTTQASVDGIIGPNTAGWLNAGNAPFWERLSPNDDISSVSSFEPFATSWAVDLILAAAPDAKAATGIDQRITALSTDDGYGSSAIHGTHRAGMDIDLGIPLSARNTGNGSLNAGEADAADFARAFIDAHLNHPELDVRVARILNSNADIIAAVNATHPGVMVNDTSGGHASHFHIDVTSPRRVASSPDLPGDFDLTDQVDADDIDLLRENFGGDTTIYNLAGNAAAVDETDLDFLITNILNTTEGDANLDGLVSQADLDAVLLNWGATDAGWATGNLDAADGTGFVSQADLDAVLLNWGNGTTAATPIPEPAAALTLAALSTLTLRRRHPLTV